MSDNTDHDIATLMADVRAHIAARGISNKDAAVLIGVGKTTLEDHLRGEHVRSDSAQRYRNWLAGRMLNRKLFVVPGAERQLNPDNPASVPVPVPLKPRLVVDIFSGCGGLSLGFDLLDKGRQFRTILALDNQVAPIAVLNRNAAALSSGQRPVGLVIDLTEFLNASEFLAFYLQHAGEILGDRELCRGLQTIHDSAFPLFLNEIVNADRAFKHRLNDIRSSPDWNAACEALHPRAVDQTSVQRFHDRLKLPRPSKKAISLPNLLWSGPAPECVGSTAPKRLIEPAWLRQAEAHWDTEAELLTDRRDGAGNGQLKASTRRLGTFADFLATDAMKKVREAWTHWRAQREAMRNALFCDEAFAAGLRSLYERAQVSVLVGGPPCQGFSRIGRGKIRSLSDARIHAQADAEAGDARNRLFEQYVMVLSALRPDIFLFENVAHFRSVVRVDGVSFQATELLEEAIERVSLGEARYEVAQAVIDASRHGIPQTRQRYFMAGVLTGTISNSSGTLAATCLDLRRERDAPLSLALAGLPVPSVVGGDVKASDAMNVQHYVDAGDPDSHVYVRWVRQPRPDIKIAPSAVDAHACRAARTDDAALFSLLGPGKRWMDYRADLAETGTRLIQLIDALLASSPQDLKKLRLGASIAGETLPNTDELQELRRRLDGALPIRLLLEQIGVRLGSAHHLLAGNYISKRESNHGDWLARLDPSRPSKTMTSHMSKDTYAYVHPWAPRTISVREAARIQSFPDWFSFGGIALTDAFKMIGNAVPPMLSHAIAYRVAHVLHHRTDLACSSRQRA